MMRRAVGRETTGPVAGTSAAGLLHAIEVGNTGGRCLASRWSAAQPTRPFEAKTKTFLIKEKPKTVWSPVGLPLVGIETLQHHRKECRRTTGPLSDFMIIFRLENAPGVFWNILEWVCFREPDPSGVLVETSRNAVWGATSGCPTIRELNRCSTLCR